MSGWIAWSKNAMACKRCHVQTLHYPCVECGFKPKEKTLVIDGERYHG